MPLPLSFPPIQCETQREKEGLERERPLPTGRRATPPAGAGGLQGLFAQLGSLLAPHLQEKGTTRSSVYSGISGSQRELFSSEMKRKQTICQVNRRHCSQRCQGLSVGWPLRSLSSTERAYSEERPWLNAGLLQLKRDKGLR